MSSKASRQRAKAKQYYKNLGKVPADKAMKHALSLTKEQRGWKPRDERIANMKMPAHRAPLTTDEWLQLHM